TIKVVDSPAQIVDRTVKMMDSPTQIVEKTAKATNYETIYVDCTLYYSKLDFSNESRIRCNDLSINSRSCFNSNHLIFDYFKCII
ncbi:hypothetical protein, partial [Lysinibacillus sp. NPDC093688]|uniref:hypothetical protein n=1 Tax=Lysinibacillus sp. NPDC093688 TaxID=3390577 RepID=UPI003D065267